MTTTARRSSEAADDYVPAAGFNVLSPGGPTICHHTGGIIGNNLYVHGGIDKSRLSTPLNGFHKYCFDTGIWMDLTDTDSPALSYHASVVLQDRYLVLIGGWDGKSRTSDLNVYDGAQGKWLPCETHGFPIGSGLSSHTANLLSNDEILVVGREGFLKTQRRFASMFLISSNPSKDDFIYKPLETTVCSRSGHTCDILRDKLYIIGGRNDNMLERHPFLYTGSNAYYSSVHFKKYSKEIQEAKVATRKYHVTSVCNQGECIFMHGGWTFDGKKKDPVSDCYLLNCTSPNRTKWISLGDSNIQLAGHLTCVKADKIYMQGGEGRKGAIKGTLYEVEAKKVKVLLSEDEEVPFYDFEW